ncbi:MAG: MarR family winged helix-turn-helix transcriptional regulator [Acidimicrobiales bacterium]
MARRAKEQAALLRAEQDIRNRLGERELDFDSLQAISNIYRAASAVRRRAEREVLAEHGLSWGGFTILWVLWIWGEMETAQLAGECGLAKGTLTGMVSTLENQQFVERQRVATDRRRVTVALSPRGLDTIETLFPTFNAYETKMSGGLSTEDKRELARLLRAVITNAGAS